MCSAVWGFYAHFHVAWRTFVRIDGIWKLFLIWVLQFFSNALVRNFLLTVLIHVLLIASELSFWLLGSGATWGLRVRNKPHATSATLWFVMLRDLHFHSVVSLVRWWHSQVCPPHHPRWLLAVVVGPWGLDGDQSWIRCNTVLSQLVTYEGAKWQMSVMHVWEILCELNLFPCSVRWEIKRGRVEKRDTWEGTFKVK